MSARSLAAGLATLGLDLPATAQEKLLAFRDLLLKWNRTYNLTAVREPEQVLSHHLLDSLAILPWVSQDDLLDVGSGGGLPGIPLAIARPTLSLTLVDAVQKKISFLQQVIIELALPNVRVVHGRIEELAGQYGQISSRAFSDLGEFVGLTRHLLAPGGRWLAMKGLKPETEIAALPCEVSVQAVHPLSVPGLQAERHLIILKAGS